MPVNNEDIAVIFDEMDESRFRSAFRQMKFMVVCLVVLIYAASTGGVMAQTQENIALPKILPGDEQALSQLLKQRRSVREFQSVSLSLEEIGQLLWAAQGITHPLGYRTAPSAGALYPLELYVVVGQVEGMDRGVYHYLAKEQRLVKTLDGDKRKRLARAAYWQSWISDAPAVVVFTAVYKRTTRKYGSRGKRFVHIEVGHAAQNLFLQAVSLGLASVVVGAFGDDDVKDLLQLPDDVEPMIMMPVGKKAGR